MAKEMMIIFVYDTELAEAEESDLSSAIIYFHPSWVSDQQKTSLCGQIIGTSHCLKTVFNCPRILALQSGKFSICDYGRYILVVGSDRNIADWVLEHRTHILSSFVTFFHKDLQSMSELYQNNNFSTKLYYMFETYLNVLMYGGNMFFNIPTIQLPKSASNVFLEAVQILRSYQKINNVLGGTILYHNKVVATQLTSNITKWLILTDPYRIKSPAEIIKTDFPLPAGMQLLQVYIQEEDYEDLRLEATRLRSIHQCFLNKNSIIQAKPNQVKEPLLMTMKRDQSLIFTTVPEEGSESLPHTTTTTKTQRPKFLNLRTKTTDLKQEAKEPSNTFLGNISICSTPMSDLNKMLYQTSMSICTNAETNNFDTNNLSGSQKSDSLNSLLSATSDVYIESSKNESAKDIDKIEPYCFKDNLYNIKKSLSLTDIMSLKANDSVDELVTDRKLRKTIMDPTFPVFTPQGLLISEHLYNYNICNGELLTMQIADGVKKQPGIEDKKEIVSAKETSKDELQQNIQNKKFVQMRDNNKFRKSLTLPLKSLSSETNSLQNVSTFNKCNGVQLTPLLSKLSALAMEERSSGFCSIETTPNDFKDVKNTMRRNMLFRSNSKAENTIYNQEGKKLQSVILLIYGQQDMVINLLLEDEAAKSSDSVNQIHQICVNYLGKLEKQIHSCLELCPGGNTQNEGSDPYSYLCMNPLWDTIKKGGPWNALELGALTHLHRDFTNIRNLTEILLRDDDGIIYAHNCGKTEVYYHQSAASNAGLPTPVDPMSIIALKARRRLERDHAIILH